MDDEAGRELLGLLDGLPLALAQAASYIRETGLDTASYVRLYKQQWDDLMGSDGEPGSPLVDYEQGSVATTWTVSFKAVEAQNKNAANLLRLWAFVDGRDLWHGLLQAAVDGGEQWPGWLCDVAGNEVRYMDAVRLLLRYSMIESRESVQGSHMMHPVVHRWASHIQDGAGKREVLRLVVMVVGSSVPSSTSKDYWVVQRRLLPHAERCSWWIGEIYKAGRSLDDRRAIDAMHMLGLLYADQGRLAEAESMYQRAVEGKEKALGRDHPSTLDTVNNLGILYADQGRLTEAESMYQRALEGCEKALGRDHPSTLDTVNNLGIFYADQGRLAEAESMYQRALSGFRVALGPSHRKTELVMRNLDLLPHAKGMSKSR
jgi:tetratricopeptide (TPR) repeat protein